MPKRKKLPKTPDYEGMGTHSDNAEIQKARPLKSLSETDLTLPEFKILDAYLARINSHDNSKRTVRLEKGELEKALGVTEIKKDDLTKRLRHLFQVIEVKDESKRKGFKLINLFEEADAEQDDDKLWQITLTCTPSAREYIFNIDNIGYLRYRLKNVINLTSRYSYVLFLYLLDNRFRKTWNIDLVELKALLNCNADRYKQFKFFNAEILKKCQKELCEKTDIRFTYKSIKRGKSVSAVEFTVETFADKVKALTDQSEDKPEQLLEQNTTESEFMDEEDIISQLRQVCNYDFTHEEIQSAYSFAKTFVNDKAIQIYFEQTYLKLLEVEKKRKIRSRFRYFYRIVCSDAERQRKEQQEREIERSQGYEATYDIAEYESTSVIDKWNDWDE